MKKLGKTLIIISLTLLVLDYAWMSIWELRIEPAGNPIQTAFLAMPYWFNRIFSYITHSLFNSRMELFWLGVALLIVGKNEPA